MGDYLKLMSNEKDLISLTSKVISVLKCHGFNLKKFISNSEKVLQSLQQSTLHQKYVNLEFSSPISERVLGLIWNIQKDTFTFKPIIKYYPDTKRGILSLMSSILDPLGILTLCLHQLKHIVQQLRKQNTGWDETIPNSLLKQWEFWKEDMQFISDINIPRWFGFEKQLGDRIELNIFCDASSEAYGAAAYVNYFSECPKKHISSFLLSKSRLAPIKEKSLTIPRLELQAAVLAIRLKNTISKQLDFLIDETRFWSDSQIDLKYIANKDTRFPVFVMNRLNEIRLHSTPEQWYYVPTSQNPTCFVPFSELKLHQS